MKVHKAIAPLFAIVSLLLSPQSSAEDQPGDVDATTNFFGYGSVENAIKELSLMPGAQVRETGDRTVISIDAEKVKWEFPSKSQPYYPSIIRSRVLFTGGQLDYQVEISCGAEQTRCDQMAKSYAANVKAVQERFQGR